MPPDEAAQTYDADLARLVTTLRDTPPDTAVPHWAAVQQVAASWQRRAVHELAVHRWDAETIGGDPARSTRTSPSTASRSSSRCS